MKKSRDTIVIPLTGKLSTYGGLESFLDYIEDDPIFYTKVRYLPRFELKWVIFTINDEVRFRTTFVEAKHYTWHKVDGFEIEGNHIAVSTFEPLELYLTLKKGYYSMDDLLKRLKGNGSNLHR